jgi:apolipoprotein N-acyltransferase
MISQLARTAAALCSAPLFILAYPENPAPHLVWVCLIPWLIGLGGATLGSRLLSSLLFSAIIWQVYYWTPFYESALTIAGSERSAAIFTALHWSTYMVPFLLFGALYRRCDSCSLWHGIYYASLFTLLLALTPVLFTFNLATFLYHQPVPLQLLEISGYSFLLWLILLVNLLLKNLLVIAWRRRKGDRGDSATAVHNLITLVAIGALVIGYGNWRLGQFDQPSATAKSIQVATIQANLGGKLHPLQTLRDSSSRPGYSYVELTRTALAQSPSIDLIVWPENSVTLSCDDPVISARLSRFVDGIDRPLIYQCVACEGEGTDEKCHNQSRYLDAEGVTRFTYNKQNLIPLFEWMPQTPINALIEPGLKNELLFHKGEESRLFTDPHARIIPAICYDAHSSGLIRRGVELGGELLIIQSNDRIFKRSAIGLSDLAINIITSVSYRLPMIKASNSGYGAFVEASGRILPDSITPVYQRHISIQTLHLQEETSLYRSYGDWFIFVAGLIVLTGQRRSIGRLLSRVKGG